MKTLKNFFDSFQETMVAAAFAEAGEFKAARQMTMDSKNSYKKILLGTEEHTSLTKAAKYSFDACGRLGTNLEVLHLIRQTKSAETIENPIARELNFKNIGILYYPVFSKDPLEVEIARYAVNRGDILFVVLNKDGGKKKRGSYFDSLLTNLKCPVVVPQAL